MSAYQPEPGHVTMFTTPWCGYCRNLKAQMKRADVPFTEVDIEQHPDAAEIVQQVNNGDQTVPTLLFPDGSAVTNPSLAVVRERLSAQSTAAGTAPDAA